MDDAPNLPEFVIERLLGRGAYGRVYLAREAEGLGRPVALKVFAADQREAFARELEVLGRVEELRRAQRHPGIVQALGSGEHEGRGWIALEYLEGGSLADRVAAEGPLPWERAVRWVGEAARAVEVLHEAGLFHRDVKPANLLLGADGRLRLGDFGLSRDLDASLSAAGSPAFASPEVIAHQVQPGLRARIDVYGLGATLSYLLTGETARPGRPDAFALERRGAPRRLVEVVLLAMAYEPEERPATAGALAELLEDVEKNPRTLPGVPEEALEPQERDMTYKNETSSETPFNAVAERADSVAPRREELSRAARWGSAAACFQAMVLAIAGAMPVQDPLTLLKHGGLVGVLIVFCGGWLVLRALRELLHADSGWPFVRTAKLALLLPVLGFIGTGIGFATAWETMIQGAAAPTASELLDGGLQAWTTTRMGCLAAAPVFALSLLGLLTKRGD